MISEIHEAKTNNITVLLCHKKLKDIAILSPNVLTGTNIDLEYISNEFYIIFFQIIQFMP